MAIQVINEVTKQNQTEVKTKNLLGKAPTRERINNATPFCPLLKRETVQKTLTNVQGGKRKNCHPGTTFDSHRTGPTQFYLAKKMTKNALCMPWHVLK